MGPLELGARGRRGSRTTLRRRRSPRLRIAVCVRDRRAEAPWQRARAPRLRVCLALSTCVSATIITPEVWARPCTRLSFVRGGAMPPGNARWHVSPPPARQERLRACQMRGGGGGDVAHLAGFARLWRGSKSREGSDFFQSLFFSRTPLPLVAGLSPP